jgi:putative ATP-dependent endonuclease of OLD family
MPKDYNYNTLEPLMLLENGRDTMNSVLRKNYKKDDELRKYMKDNKTESALAVFEHTGTINFPAYIMKAIEYVSQ